MKILKHWKVILTIVLVFAAGAVTGSVGTVLKFKYAFERGLSVQGWNSQVMGILQKELKLTPEQQPKIRAIVQETGQEFGQTFGQAIRVSGTNLVVFWHRLDQVLTPEQRVIHHQKCDEFRGKVKQALQIDLPPDLPQQEGP